jgi:hypothetical protein
VLALGDPDQDLRRAVGVSGGTAGADQVAEDADRARVLRRALVDVGPRLTDILTGLLTGYVAEA